VKAFVKADINNLLLEIITTQFQEMQRSFKQIYEYTLGEFKTKSIRKPITFAFSERQPIQKQVLKIFSHTLRILPHTCFFLKQPNTCFSNRGSFNC